MMCPTSQRERPRAERERRESGRRGPRDGDRGAEGQRRDGAARRASQEPAAAQRGLRAALQSDAQQEEQTRR